MYKQYKKEFFGMKEITFNYLIHLLKKAHIKCLKNIELLH